jgi:hypothetical protein
MLPRKIYIIIYFSLIFGERLFPEDRFHFLQLYYSVSLDACTCKAKGNDCEVAVNQHSEMRKI